jgi:Mn2+-dependent serine/threonine protein kinase
VHLIKRGAEADIYLVEWYGKKAISKVRRPKQYMHHMLDREIRRKRTLHEAEMLNMAKRAMVTTPLIYFVDPLNAEIIMQYIEGYTVKDLMTNDNIEDPLLRQALIDMGIYTARLHARNIIHGDLTTSNFILHNSNRLVLIDFGLAFYSSRIEDKAVDIRLIKEVMSSAHANLFNEAFRLFIDGYASVAGEDNTKVLLKKVREIEQRGRYARVV